MRNVGGLPENAGRPKGATGRRDGGAPITAGASPRVATGALRVGAGTEKPGTGGRSATAPPAGTGKHKGVFMFRSAAGYAGGRRSLSSAGQPSAASAGCDPPLPTAHVSGACRRPGVGHSSISAQWGDRGGPVTGASCPAPCAPAGRPRTPARHRYPLAQSRGLPLAPHRCNYRRSRGSVQRISGERPRW